MQRSPLEDLVDGVARLCAGVTPAQAAAEAGFADQAHLTRWFRRYYGVTPGAYRAAGQARR